jgi:hypothetical protein
MKKVVYTSITEGFELHPVINRRDGWAFICFSEIPVQADGWEVRLIDKKDIIIENDLVPNDKTKTARRIKLLPHLYVGDYDLSIWIDASIQFRKEIDLDRLTRDFIESPRLMMVREHPYRRCVHREAEVIVRQGLASMGKVEAIISRYNREGFPENFGLAESNFLVRKHNDQKLVLFANEWWKNVFELSRRDQLYFNYLVWKHGLDIEFIDDKISPVMELLSRGKNRGPFFRKTFNYYPKRRKSCRIFSFEKYRKPVSGLSGCD